MKKNIFQNLKKNKEKGFTIIELTFVFILMAIISSVMFFNFSKFSTNTRFDNLAYDIGLHIIQAQKDSISGVVNVNFTSRNMKPSYGVFFSSSGTPGANNTKFTYFTDIPGVGTGSTATTGNKIYDDPGTGVCSNPPVSGNECISITGIATGEYVDNIYYKSGGVVYHSDSSSADISIVFTRPFPDASIVVHNPVGSTQVVAQSACIELATPSDPSSRRTISVSSLGQISVFGVSASTTPICTS